MSARIRLLALIVMALIALGGCGDDDEGSNPSSSGDGSAEAVSEEEITVATPFPSGLSFPELYVAKANGHFEDEKLKVSIEPLDGSGSTLQALSTNRADVAVPSPGPVFQAAQEGGTPLSIYTAYQRGIFTLVTIPDAGVSSLEDIRGGKVGVGALDGGEVPVVKAMLAEAGLQEGEDYELLAVGDGGTASTGLRKGDIKAYGAAFIDVLIMNGSGIETVDLSPEGFQGGTDTHYVVNQSMRDENPELIVRFGRALASAAAWVDANPDEALEVVCGEFPEECEDKEFAKVILDAVRDLEALPAEAEGQWGYTDTEAIQSFADLLLEQGELEGQPDAAALFTNEFVGDFNG